MSRTKRLLEEYHYYYPELDSMYGHEYHSRIIEIHKGVVKAMKKNSNRDKDPLEDEFKKCNLAFVYGTLMSGYGNNDLIAHCEMLGKAETSEKYVMTGSGIPFVSKDTDLDIIKGEVWKISDTSTLRQVDYLEGHPTHYYREIINVKVNSEELEAWIYFNDRSSSYGKIIENGDYRAYRGESLNDWSY